MKKKLIEWWFIQKVKRRGGVSTSFLFGKPHCAKWKNIYAGFLTDGEIDIFIALLERGILVQTGFDGIHGRNIGDYYERPLYNLNPNKP